MIIQFKVANYRSIGAEQTLSFVAENARRHPDNLIPRDGYKLLKSVALFGANASGKSNLVKAIGAMQEFVRDSATRMNEGDLIEAAEPFRLDPALRNAPSRFEITFVTNGIVYVYGFSASRERVHEEWLRAKPLANGKEAFWFERSYEHKTQTYSCLSSEPKGMMAELMLKWTRENALVLSVSAQQNLSELLPVYRYLRNLIWTFDISDGLAGQLTKTALLCQDSEEVCSSLFALLYGADAGIEGMQIRAATQRVPQAHPNALEQLNDAFRSLKRLTGVSALPRIVTSRHDSAGDIAEFDFEGDESQGTQRFFAIAGPLLDALDKGAFVVVDELDASMHPLLTRRLLELFHSAEANSKGAQLLFTTHDSSLLDQDLFRRDQIWLAEKCDGASTFFSLADIRPPIRNTESFLRNYLTGRYGGTPHLGLAFDDAIAGVKV